jgi:hypothetical protein
VRGPGDEPGGYYHVVHFDCHGSCLAPLTGVVHQQMLGQYAAELAKLAAGVVRRAEAEDHATAG